jgi:hypothetical protein
MVWKPRNQRPWLLHPSTPVDVDGSVWRREFGVSGWRGHVQVGKAVLRLVWEKFNNMTAQSTAKASNSNREDCFHVESPHIAEALMHYHLNSWWQVHCLLTWCMKFYLQGSITLCSHSIGPFVIVIRFTCTSKNHSLTCPKQHARYQKYRR